MQCQRHPLLITVHATNHPRTGARTDQLVSLRDRGRQQKSRSVGSSGEHIGIGGHGEAKVVRPRPRAVSVLDEQVDGLAVERDPALLMCLRVALAPPAGLALPDRSAYPGDGALRIQVEIVPAQGAVSPRRTPVVIAVQIKVPQSGSRHASLTMRAACSAVGGCGFGLGAAGGSAWLIGLTVTHCHRSARLYAPDNRK